MKWTTLQLVILVALCLSGCGGGSSPPPQMADAGNATPPPPADVPPPTTPGGEGGAPPPESPPPDGGAPPGGEGQAPATGTSDGGAAAGDGYQAPPPGETPGEGSPGGTPGGPDEGTGQPPAPPRVKSWREQAEDALLAGNEQEWFRLNHGNFVINPASWKALEKNMAWIPALRRPALGTRFGIAAIYTTVPRDFEGSPQPIGSPELKTAMSTLQQNAASSSGSGGGAIRRALMKKTADAAGGASGDGGGESSSPGTARSAEQTELIYHTGDFGTKLLDALKSRIESGAYGPMYKEMAETVARGRQRPATPVDPNNPSDGGEGIPSPASDTPGGRAPGNAGDGGIGDGGSSAPAPHTESGTRLATSVVWLGKAANREEVASLAQKAGIDVVVIYEIAIKTNRQSELVNNTTKMRVVTTTSLTKKEVKEPDLYVSDGLENRVVLLAREKAGKPEDPVEKEVGHAIDALDKVCKPAALPAGVTAEAVKKRLAGQIAEKPADPLPLAVEIRYYTIKKVLTESEAANGTMALMGPAEYAHLVSTASFELGSEAAVGQTLGRVMSVSGMLDALGAFNAATGNTARAEARKQQEAAAAANGQTTEPASGGLKGLLPFGFGGSTKK